MAERVLAALALGDHIMELMGSPSASLGQVEMWQDDTRKIYERLWRAFPPQTSGRWCRSLGPDFRPGFVRASCRATVGRVESVVAGLNVCIQPSVVSASGRRSEAKSRNVPWTGATTCLRRPELPGTAWSIEACQALREPELCES